MKTARTALLVLLAAPLSLVWSPAWCQDQEAPRAPEPAAQAAPSMELDTYQLVLLKRPAERAELPPERVREIQAAHMGHLGRMAREGHLVVEVMTWYTEKGALAFPAFEELRAEGEGGD